MQRLRRDEYEAAYRIYDRVETLIGPYYGHMTIEQVENFVSCNRWIMFPKNGIDSLREGVYYPFPNTCIAFDDYIDDHALQGHLCLTYHNVDAMIGFRHLLRYRRNQIISKLKDFDDSWVVEVQMKTKTDSPASIPHYDTFARFDPSALDGEKLQEQIGLCDLQLPRRGDAYSENGNPVLWSVTIISVLKRINRETFDNDVKKMFNIFLRLL